jgi:monovalent cation:H+ antiporter-2, CPA2 family
LDTSSLLLTLKPVLSVLFFGTAVAIASRFLGFNPIVGYIVLGLIGRETGFSAFDSATIDLLAQLGVVFLLFDVGLHFSWTHIRERASDIFAFGPVQILTCTLLIGLAGVLAGGAAAPMFLLGAVLALSSTAVVAKLIAERHQQNCPVGLTATAILVFQDVIGIVLLIVISSLGAGQSLLIGIAFALLKAVAAVAVTALVTRLVVGPLFTAVARTGNSEVFTAAALLMALAGGWATALIGLSLSLGAFLGGMSLAATPYRLIIHSEISPFRGLLLSVFFMSVGYGLDGDFLRHSWYLVVAATVGLFVLKAAGNILASLLFRWSVPGSTQLGLLIAQGSEFSFVLLSLPQMRVLIGERFDSILVSAIALSLAATPTVAQLGRALAGSMRRLKTPRRDHELTPAVSTAPVLIVGMGQIGRTVADALRAFDVEYYAIERDPSRLRQAIADGYDVAYGDSTDTRHWESVDLSNRAISVLTSPDWSYLRTMAGVMPARFPKLTRVAVVTDAQHLQSARDLNLHVVLDTGDPRGLAAAQAVLDRLGFDGNRIADWRRRTLQNRSALTGNETERAVLA